MKNELINELIICPKKISNKPLKENKLINGSYANNFELVCTQDENIKFTARLRQNEKFPENFSVILSHYVPELNKDIILMRYNGIHGLHKNNIIDNETMDGFHVHKATNEALENGMGAEKWASPTEEYKTFEEAVIRFWENIKIQDDINDFFSNYTRKQISLFE